MKQIINVLIDEDQEVSFEPAVDLETYQYLDYLELHEEWSVACASATKEEVLLKLNEWFNEQVGQDVSAADLLAAVDQLKQVINDLDLNTHKIIGFGEWGVEYDVNFCLLTEEL